MTWESHHLRYNAFECKVFGRVRSEWVDLQKQKKKRDAKNDSGSDYDDG